MQGTEYYEPLRKLRDSNASTLFDYDLALDLYYYTTLWKEKKKVLKKSELEIFTRDIGSKIDLLNLQWIYRAKKYFKMQPADIYSMIIDSFQDSSGYDERAGGDCFGGGVHRACCQHILCKKI